LGWGASVKFESFYVKVPSPRVLSEGTYEFPPSLRVALAYRDRLNQAIIDRGTTSLAGTNLASDGELDMTVLAEAKKALSAKSN
jgi:hypothetical protein